MAVIRWPHRRVAARNQADAAIYAAEKALKEAQGRAPADALEFKRSLLIVAERRDRVVQVARSFSSRCWPSCASC